MNERPKTPRQRSKTFDGCKFLRLGGFPCDLDYPRCVVKTGARTWDDAVKQLCAKCQPHVSPRQ